MNQVETVNRYFDLCVEAEDKGLKLRLNRDRFTLRDAKTNAEIVITMRLTDISKTIKTYVVKKDQK